MAVRRICAIVLVLKLIMVILVIIFNIKLHLNSNVRTVEGHQEVRTRKFLVKTDYIANKKSYLHVPRQCETGKIFVLIFVSSHVTNLNARRDLRATWVSVKSVLGHNVRWIFVLGNSFNKNNTREIEQESRTHGDILQRDFQDSYKNLTLKSLAGLRFAATYCRHARFVMKTDDDVTLNAEVLVKILLETPEKEIPSLYLGLTSYKGVPFREKKHKWFVSAQQYPDKYYPPYNMGMGYVFSMNALQRTLAACSKLKLFPFEDIFIGMCAQMAGITPTNNRMFSEHVQHGFDDYCVYKNYVNMHAASKLQRMDMWTHLQLNLTLEKRTYVNQCSSRGSFYTTTIILIFIIIVFVVHVSCAMYYS